MGFKNNSAHLNHQPSRVGSPSLTTTHTATAQRAKGTQAPPWPVGRWGHSTSWRTHCYDGLPLRPLYRGEETSRRRSPHRCGLQGGGKAQRQHLGRCSCFTPPPRCSGLALSGAISVARSAGALNGHLVMGRVSRGNRCLPAQIGSSTVEPFSKPVSCLRVTTGPRKGRQSPKGAEALPRLGKLCRVKERQQAAQGSFSCVSHRTHPLGIREVNQKWGKTPDDDTGL